MSFRLPFTKESLTTDMVGKTFVLASNVRGQSQYSPIKEMTVKDVDGTCNDGIRLEAVNGILYLFDRNTLFAMFSEIGTNGDVVFAVGYSTLEISKSGYDRFILYEKVMLSTLPYGICISSHVDFEKRTLPVILGSLTKSGFDKSRVFVVIGGDKRNDGVVEDRDGVIVVRKNVATMGFVALTEIARIPGMAYWLLLHDTCEFEKNFVDKAGQTDVGLRQDMVLFRPKEDNSELGFYKTSFVANAGVDVSVKNLGAFSAFIRASSTVTSAGKPETGAEKDIYGEGTKRKIVFLPAGVKKYEGRTARGGRP